MQDTTIERLPNILGNLAKKLIFPSYSAPTKSSNAVINKETAVSTQTAPQSVQQKVNVEANNAQLADLIGQRVAAAFKSGMFQFEFVTDKSGVLSYE